MDGARYQQLRHDMVEDWIKSLSHRDMENLCFMAYEIKRDGNRREIWIAPEVLRDSLLRVLNGEEFDIVLMAKPEEVA